MPVAHTDDMMTANISVWLSSKCYPERRRPGHIWSSAGRKLSSRNMAASTGFWLPVHC